MSHDYNATIDSFTLVEDWDAWLARADAVSAFLEVEFKEKKKIEGNEMKWINYAKELNFEGFQFLQFCWHTCESVDIGSCKHFPTETEYTAVKEINIEYFLGSCPFCKTENVFVHHRRKNRFICFECHKTGEALHRIYKYKLKSHTFPELVYKTKLTPDKNKE